MAKKSSKLDWRKQAEKTQAEVGGTDSFFWGAEMSKWQDFTLHINTITARPEQVEKDGEMVDHAWKKRTYVEITVDSEQREEEIPFWCSDDFFSELLDSDIEEDVQEVDMQYKRTKKGDNNSGKFRLLEDD